MSETFEKQLISVISTCWNETAPSILGCSSTLSLLASREVHGEGMSAALAVANTWSSAFALPLTSGATGVLVCLFKSDDSEEIDRLIKQEADGLPKPGGRALIASVMQGIANTVESMQVSFGEVSHFDLAANETRLAAIVGDLAHIGTYSLVIGSDLNSQALMLYAPNGSLDTESPMRQAQSETSSHESPSQSAVQSPSQNKRSTNQRRVEAAPRNIERLLDVELDVIVRFGVTNVPLRDVVRMGVGTMIELNRTVDEPVELLVNGRSLARGEVVVVDGYYGVRITEIGPSSERAAALA